MKASWQTISIGLDQLFFGKLLDDESPLDRADAIDKFLKINGWTWDDVIKELSQDNDIHGRVCTQFTKN